jgi:NADH:ubiquinone reductase (non-electrogenic)
LFTPLLPSATSGTVETRSIMEPIRRYCRRSDAEEAQFIEVEATKIDAANNRVHCVDTSPVQGSVHEFDLEYDHLVIAVGADSATFGIPGVKENGIFLKSNEDATKIRNRVMDCMETASIPGQPDSEIQRLLHFVVVGGGPAGVEYAADLHDFLERDLKRTFPELKEKVKITLIEALPHILSMFDATIIERVERKFQTTPGLEILLRSAVTAVEPTVVKVKASDGVMHDVPYVR